MYYSDVNIHILNMAQVLEALLTLHVANYIHILMNVRKIEIYFLIRKPHLVTAYNLSDV